MQTDMETQRPSDTESSPLALPSLDDHPQIVQAYDVKVRCEQAFAAAQAALKQAQARVQQSETERITALMTGEQSSTTLPGAISAASTAERDVKIAYQAVQKATEQWTATRERIRQELMAKCKVLYCEHLATAVADAERACQSHTMLSRLYSRMHNLCGPLSWNDLHYPDLMEDNPPPASHWQGWYRVVTQSGLLPKK